MGIFECALATVLRSDFATDKSPFIRQKIRKNVKSIVGISPTMVLLFSSSFLFEDVKDEIYSKMN
jgi:hypothetical protein